MKLVQTTLGVNIWSFFFIGTMLDCYKLDLILSMGLSYRFYTHPKNNVLQFVFYIYIAIRMSLKHSFPSN